MMPVFFLLRRPGQRVVLSEQQVIFVRSETCALLCVHLLVMRGVCSASSGCVQLSFEHVCMVVGGICI